MPYIYKSYVLILVISTTAPFWSIQKSMLRATLPAKYSFRRLAETTITIGFFFFSAAMLDNPLILAFLYIYNFFFANFQALYPLNRYIHYISVILEEPSRVIVEFIEMAQ